MLKRKTKMEMIKMIEVEILKAKAQKKELARITLGCSAYVCDVKDLVKLYDNSQEFEYVNFRINKYGNKIMFIIF